MTTPMLSETLLPTLNQTAIQTPTYSRASLTPSFVHIGVGAFHRAHLETYLEDLASQGVRNCGVIGVGLLPGDNPSIQLLRAQDNLYTVVTRNAEETTFRVIGTLVETLSAVERRDAVLERMTLPEIQIVSLTITEGGYGFSPETGSLQTDLPAIARDLQNPQAPESVYGFLVEALHRRRKAGRPPFTVLSCDNLLHNGDTARKMTLQFAEKRDPSLASWIAETVTFPNTMVDRITPASTDELRTLVRDTGGFTDAVPVGCEPFRQWVIEDRFCSGRPPFEQVGATFTKDVTPYETAKIRLLNAGHSAIGYLGALAGYAFIHEILADPLFSEFLTRLMQNEITPMLTPPADLDLETYGSTVRERFSNPVLKDQTARICGDASNKIPKFLLPTLRERLAQNLPSPLLALALTGWFRALQGSDDFGRPLQIADPLSAALEAAARRNEPDFASLLALPIFGDLASASPFREEVARWLASLVQRGARETLSAALNPARNR